MYIFFFLVAPTLRKLCWRIVYNLRNMFFFFNGPCMSFRIQTKPAPKLLPYGQKSWLKIHKLRFGERRGVYWHFFLQDFFLQTSRSVGRSVGRSVCRCFAILALFFTRDFFNKKICNSPQGFLALVFTGNSFFRAVQIVP